MVDVFISSQNPGFKSGASPEENQERMLQLQDDLIRIGIPKENIHVSHYTEKGGYSEDSFFVTGIEVEDAIGLAERYNQVEILTDEGIVDIKSTKLRLPTKQKITGPEAEAQEHYSQVEGIGPVSYQFGEPDIEHGEEAGSDLYSREAAVKMFLQICDDITDEVLQAQDELSPLERDQIIALATQAKEKALNDDLEGASEIMNQITQLGMRSLSQGKEGEAIPR